MIWYIIGLVCFFIALGAYESLKKTTGKEAKQNKIMMVSLILIGIFFLISGHSSRANKAEQAQKANTTQTTHHKKAVKHYNKDTTTGLKGYLNQKTTIGVKDVKMLDGVLVIKTSDMDFHGKTLGVGELDSLIDGFSIAKASKLASNGVDFVQVGEYSDSKGHNSKDTDYSVYYSKSDLDSINWKNYSSVVYDDKDTFLENSTSYYFNPSFKNSDDNWIFSDNVQPASNSNVASKVATDILN